MRLSVISFMQWCTRSSGATVITGLDMMSATGVSVELRPCSTTFRA